MFVKIPREIIAKKNQLFKPTAYDIRAYVGEPGDFFSADAVLTPEVMELTGAMMGSMVFTLNNGSKISLKPGDIVVVGHDNGPTSKQLSDAFAKGLTGQGIDVYYLGIASSGQVYHNEQQFNAQGHVQITRSHVEVTTNGAKFALKGYGIHTYLLAQMNEQLASGHAGREAPEGKFHDKIAEGRKLYEERMKARYGGYFKAHPRKLALNLFGGTAVEYKSMFESIFGSDTVILGADLNVNEGALLADPTRKEMLARVPGFKEALAQGLRIYSFDLDADRLSISEGASALDVGGAGHYLGDDMVYIIADYKLSKAVPTFIAGLEDRYPREKLDKIHDICTTVYVDPRYSGAVRSYILRNGGISVYHRKGHSLWKETMSAKLFELAELTGYASTQDFIKATGWQDMQMEASLHMFATDPEDGAVRDDGLESVFILEKIADELGISNLCDYYAAIPRRFMTKEIRTGSVSNEIKEKITYYIIEKLKTIFGGGAYEIVEFDGQLRVDWDTGFIMYGMSNTSPKLTFMAEGESVEERNRALAFILALHNSAKAVFSDNLPMDIGENSFFKDDPSFEISEPDGLDFCDQKTIMFIREHELTLE